MSANILLVDDNKNFLRVLSYQLQEFGFHVVPTGSAQEALDCFQEQKFDLIISDMRMPGMNGLQLLSQIREIAPETPVIILSAHGTTDTAVEAMRRGAFAFLTKPFVKEQIRRAIANALMTRLPAVRDPMA